MTGLIVSVYEPDGTTLISRVPRRRNVQFLDELNGDGTGSFEVPIGDEILTTHPTLLDGGNIVKVRPSTATSDVFAWVIEQVVPTLTDQEEDGWGTAVSGRGVRTVLAKACVYPEYGLAVNSADQRSFDFSSATGAWYISGDWTAPLGVRQDADPTARANYPRDWPDGAAQWIWKTSPTVAASAGRQWFRSTITVPSDGPVGFWATADNSFVLYLDGERVLESPDPTDLFQWKEMSSYSAFLTAGTHVVAVSADNAVFAGSNPAGFLCTIATLDGAGIPVTVLRRTDTSNWLVHDYAPPQPGWHAASILKQLVTEAQARSVAALAPVTFGFSDSTDTASVAWTDVQATAVNVGDDLLNVLGLLISLGIDVDLAPNLVLNAWIRKGTDLSATVRLLPGRDVLANTPTARYGALRNSALMRHGSGWVLVEDSTSITAHGRAETSITAGTADNDTQAAQVAQSFFDESAHPQVTLPLTLSSASGGAQPYAQFVKGDTVTTPGLTGTLGPARVMSISASESEDGAAVTWELDLYPEVS